MKITAIRIRVLRSRSTGYGHDAAEIIGWGAKRASEVLPTLRPGHFIASGTAFNVSPAVVTIGAVRSRHIGAAPAISAPPLPSAEEAEALLGIDDLQDEAKAPHQPKAFRAVRSFMANSAAPLATRIVRELAPLWPAGAGLADLQKECAASDDAFSAALKLLGQFNAVTIEGQAIRIEKGMSVIAQC